jgi:hypothetical protein
MFPGEASEEYASAMALTPPAGAERRNVVALATTAQQKAFDEWRGASPRGITECTETCGITEFAAVSNAAMEAATPPPARRGSPAKSTESTEGDDADADADADPGKCRTVTSCISSGEDSACEDDGCDSWETESEDFEPSSEWELGWKDYLIVIQFVAIVLLVWQLNIS